MSSFCGSDNDTDKDERIWWQGYNAGAAVAFGLVGMAEAIRNNHLYSRNFCPSCRYFWEMTEDMILNVCGAHQNE